MHFTFIFRIRSSEQSKRRSITFNTFFYLITLFSQIILKICVLKNSIVIWLPLWINFRYVRYARGYENSDSIPAVSVPHQWKCFSSDFNHDAHTNYIKQLHSQDSVLVQFGVFRCTVFRTVTPVVALFIFVHFFAKT